MTWRIECGDCREVMARMPESSVDAIVTDPPYGLEFMGKDWDHGIPGAHFWQLALRVAKPGAHLLAFGGTRTFHRLACAIEDAGWEIRDCVMWVYGSGFPKSHNLDGDWQGWGTALKPAWEPIIVARKPLVGTVAENVERFGTGALNIDGARVGVDGGTRAVEFGADLRGVMYGGGKGKPTNRIETINAGRWPANLIHDGSEEVVAGFPSQAGASGQASGPTKVGMHKSGSMAGTMNGTDTPSPFYGDTGSAARFFYCAKASRADREDGCEGLQRQFLATMGDGIGAREHNDSEPTAWTRNHHPTVKPTALMRYLCRLVTPPGGTVFDPFAGSGSTGRGAVLEGFSFVGIEREQEYVTIAQARIAKARGEVEREPVQGSLF